MSDFCPDGYVPSQIAIIEASQKWFSERWAVVQTPNADNSAIEAEPRRGVNALAWALSQPPIPWEVQVMIADVVPKTVHRLRNYLFQDKLKAYYFGGLFEGRHEVHPAIWVTPQGDGVLESGIFFPLGKPDRSYQQPLNVPIFFQRVELDTLLQKPALPQTPAAQTDPPGRKAGRQSGKGRASRAVLSILNDDTKRPIRSHGWKAELARMVCTVLQSDGDTYEENSVQKMIRDTVKDWEDKNPEK
jgi:hypothetical protein